jgi:glycosyltransferase involved in cell wall biosynthesis
MSASITIVTPTFNRSSDILSRCIDCVEGQTYTNWHQIIIADDKDLSGHVCEEIQAKYASPKRTFMCTGSNTKNWGNTPKQYGINAAKSDFIVFVDDDNVIFPNYLMQFIKYFEENPSHGMAICKIIHCGPLAPYWGTPPKILNGNPPTVQNIDTMQICIRTPIAKECAWLDLGYCGDGHTINNFSNHCEFGYISEILAVHL